MPRIFDNIEQELLPQPPQLAENERAWASN